MTRPLYISFQWTTPALRARAKTVTRRSWTFEHAKRFRRGLIVDAYDRRPEWGGQRVGRIRIAESPYTEFPADIPDDDWVGEGFAWLEKHPEQLPKVWRREGLSLRDRWQLYKESTEMMWVIRFEIVSIVPVLLKDEQMILFE